jgi:hypothetical protein
MAIKVVLAIFAIVAAAGLFGVIANPTHAVQSHRWCSGEVGDPSIVVCWDSKADCMKHYLRDGPCVKQKI